MKTYYLYFIQAYEESDPSLDRLSNYSEVRVIADNEKDALVKAKKMVDKKHYRVAGVTEYVIDKQYV